MARLTPLVRAALQTVALTALTFVGAALPAQAQSSTEASSQSRQFSSKAGTLVLEAQKLMSDNQYHPALAVLAKALSLADLTPYERSIMLQMQGASHYELTQFGPAITSFEQALNAGGFNRQEAEGLNLQIAQLMIANGQHASGATRLEDYLAQNPADNQKYSELLFQAWNSAENYNKALPWARRWYEAATPKDKKHFDALNYLYNKLGYADQQADVVMQMIERWPEEKELWDVWTSLFVAADQDEDAFEVTRLQYLGGALNAEADLLKVVQYYSFYDMPFQAAQILEKEINAGRIDKTAASLEQLSSLWRQAREYARAIPVLEEATRLLDKADLHAQLGEALYNEGECGRAEAAFTRAIDKGYSAGKAWMLIGTCRYEEVQSQAKLSCEMNADEKAAAQISQGRVATLAAFENVPNQSQQSRDAQKWISFVKAEKLTFDKQCEVKEQIRTEECYKDIKRAYDNEFIDGQFILGDTSCQAYVAAYDKEYRTKDAG